MTPAKGGDKQPTPTQVKQQEAETLRSIQDNLSSGFGVADIPPIESSAQNQARQGAKIVQQAQRLATQPSGPDLNTSVMTICSRYRHENQNSIYYVRPNSNDIYFLDFKLKGFVKEQLRWHRGRGVMPVGATTA